VRTSWSVLRLFTALALAAASTAAVAAQSPPLPDPPQVASPDQNAVVAGDQRSAPSVADRAAKTAPAEPSTVPDDQSQAPAGTRQAAIEQEQAAKANQLHPYVPNKGEVIFQHVDTILEGGTLRWHPFFENAYSGGGFTLGVGHTNYVSAYNYIDIRGSYTLSNYKRVEAEFVAPRLFNRRGHLSVLGGWRDATEVGFYGIGTDTSLDDKTNYRFQQPYLSGLLTVFPRRNVLMLRGGVEYSQWNQKHGEGTSPSVEQVYTPATLPGLGAKVNYLHTQGTVGLDWRTSPGYSRRGVYFGVTGHDYRDSDDEFGFRMVEYNAIQHIPILREAWVLSFHERVQTAFDNDNQEIPFFMLPALGGGSSLRGYSSWRFRDMNSLLLQAEWRIMVNRYLDMAFFYDAGKVAAKTSDLDFDHLKDNWGFGLRFHGPFSTPLRVELAHSRESTISFIFSSSASF
jgi:surface antigen Omp85-like protein